MSQIKTRKDSTEKDLFKIGFLKPDFKGGKEPIGRDVVNVFQYNLNESPQNGLEAAASITATKLESVWEKNGIPIMNHYNIKMKVLSLHNSMRLTKKNPTRPKFEEKVCSRILSFKI